MSDQQRQRAAFEAGQASIRAEFADLLGEPMDPYIDRDRLGAYLRGEIEWETLNSPEQAQIMDWRLR